MSLVDLETLDNYRIPGDEIDPRGWSVVACDGITVGKVRSLLVDLGQSKVRYFLCDIDQRRVALPTAFARLDPAEKRVIFDTAPSEAIRGITPYTGSLLPAQAEALDAAIVGDTIKPATPGESVDRRSSGRREDQS
jgi:hypothetical protein